MLYIGLINIEVYHLYCHTDAQMIHFNIPCMYNVRISERSFFRHDLPCSISSSSASSNCADSQCDVCWFHCRMLRSLTLQKRPTVMTSGRLNRLLPCRRRRQQRRRRQPPTQVTGRDGPENSQKSPSTPQREHRKVCLLVDRKQL